MLQQLCQNSKSMDNKFDKQLANKSVDRLSHQDAFVKLDANASDISLLMTTLLQVVNRIVLAVYI